MTANHSTDTDKTKQYRKTVQQTKHNKQKSDPILSLLGTRSKETRWAYSTNAKHHMGEGKMQSVSVITINAVSIITKQSETTGNV